MGPQQRAADLHELLGGLALAVHHLGVPATTLTVRIQPRVAQIELPGATEGIENRADALLGSDLSVLNGPKEDF